MAKDTDPTLALEGRCLNVYYATGASGRLLAKAFILEAGNARAKLWTLIKRLADNGIIHNEQQFRSLDEHIWEIKVHSPGCRILCYFHNGNLYLTHGSLKVKKKEFQTEIAKATRIRLECLSD